MFIITVINKATNKQRERLWVDGEIKYAIKETIIIINRTKINSWIEIKIKINYT